MKNSKKKEIPNKETLEAIQEVEDIIAGKKKAKVYNSVDELIQDILKDDE